MSHLSASRERLTRKSVVLMNSLCPGAEFHIASLCRVRDIARQPQRSRASALSCPHRATATAAKEREHGSSKSPFWILALGSIGVVYGDIGTSPLYAMKELLTAARGSEALTSEMVFGVLSLMLWTLIVIVTLKYVIVMLRADNNGEGGTLSLMALAQRALGDRGGMVALLGMAGAALFYGDAMITPAISVLSAVEGLNLVTPAFERFVLPISLAILIGLFAIQSRGTARIAAWFGPIIVVWFIALAVGGLVNIAQRPDIVLALNPFYGVTSYPRMASPGSIALGAVFLAVTGAEALYADLGHFGRGPIRAAWLCLVFPALALNYLGQGALLLDQPAGARKPVLQALSGMGADADDRPCHVATIIASQAVITGAYSMTQQAIQLGLLPRMNIRRTSADRTRADLYPGRELDTCCWPCCSSRRRSRLQRAGLRLWHRSDRNDGGDGRARDDRGALLLAVVVVACRPRDGAVHGHRSRVSGRQSA